MSNAAPRKIEVVQVEWLRPGWVLALRQDGCEATRFDIPRGESPIFAQSVLARLEQLRTAATTRGIFLSQEDCALVTEHFPDVFYRNKS
jgi:hypothetical protein